MQVWMVASEVELWLELEISWSWTRATGAKLEFVLGCSGVVPVSE